jgi:hypothetical protein
LDELGWLQFERLCSLVLKTEAGLDLSWRGRPDRCRVATVEGHVALRDQRVRLDGPASVSAVWVRNDRPLQARLSEFSKRMAALFEDRSVPLEGGLMLLTNLESDGALAALRAQTSLQHGRLVLIGATEIAASLDRDPGLRAALPSVLGLRDLEPLIDRAVRARSAFDIDSAQGLARVFWPTRAYDRARAVLARHRFVVLTGAPEMGKTAIALMLALAQLTDGWESHECNDPDEVWRVFDRERRQLFIADDAFGSTEYRPDAAERWARGLGRLLKMLDQRHWLIWTSRPAPLKAGLRRVQRERGSERFPAPGEVLVDASDLDLAEKTLILFRHAKARKASDQARRLLRSAGLSIVEHPHFTPERIRRFVNERLDELPRLAGRGEMVMSLLVERDLTSPTEAMRNSFRALEREHRDLLVALLDAPAGLIDERELAATVRRHRAGGLSRPPGDLIDRLTDHFLRVTPLGIGWVHPSWRDLVIDELRSDPGTRQRFLASCGTHGLTLALSQQGGLGGERSLPLLVADRDWDRLGDRLHELLHELGDEDLARVLLALAAALEEVSDRGQRLETQSLAAHALETSRRAWDRAARPLPAFLLEAWYALGERVPEPVAPPSLVATWAELHPGLLLLERPDRAELVRTDEWLALARTLSNYDPEALQSLGFFDRDTDLLGRLIVSLTRTAAADEQLRPLAEAVLSRIEELAPELADRAHSAREIAQLAQELELRRWWVPEDIPAPPSFELVAARSTEFGRHDVARVLDDL